MIMMDDGNDDGKTKYKKYAAKVKVQCFTNSYIDGFLGKESYSDGDETDAVKPAVGFEVF